MKLLVVESPAKAKTIKGYLNDEFEVLASIGHFRDLPEKGMGIEENEDFSVKKWEIDNKKIDPIIKTIKKSDEIFLALDPDREGELIAWHLIEICKEKKLTDNRSFKRIEFSAIRKEDIINAIKNPREINQDLVNAAITRRFLDRFFGYKISPITKRRTIFGNSAGRVQSPTLKILCEKEKEIDLFIEKEFWELDITLNDKQNNTVSCDLVSILNKKFNKLSVENKVQAENLKERISNSKFLVDSIVKREKRRQPYSPYSNSLLLQDASSKLGFSPKYTNAIAQQLKDGDGLGGLGALITYHRTDSNRMKNSEVLKLRELISSTIGEDYVSEKEIIYKEKSKFVQQGHEAVTPTQLKRKPDDIRDKLSPDQFKLYDLIWKRTIASQMKPSKSLETLYYLKSEDFLLKASGSIKIFDGFKKIYDFSDSKDESQILPNLEKDEKLEVKKLGIKQNFTKPPNRYSEAGLIKKLEELGIGRPSTYVSIFTKLEKNSYINIKNKSLIPTGKGKILVKFLDGFFDKFVDYGFTADLEEQLDLITESKLDWKSTLNKFLEILNQTVNQVEKQSITQVIDKINENSSEILKEKECKKCKDGKLTIKFAFSGPFVGCTNYNKDGNGCTYSHALGENDENKELSGDGKLIGINDETKQKIFLKVGRYGRYLETLLDDGKSKRTSIPKKMKNEEIDIDKSIKLLSLPRKIGEHPESRKVITASIGPYGPYLKHDNKYVSLKEDDVTEIGINRAVELIDKNIKSNQDIIIGEHPTTKKKIIQKKGIKGRPDYLSYNKKNFSITDDIKDKKISLDEALKIIDEKISKQKKETK